MLKRILEPEVMDSAQEATDYDQMDHREVNRQFVDDLMALDPPAGEFLDLGTGTARIPIELCQRGPEARVVAVDLAENMLDVARINLELANLMDQILLDRVDAKNLPYEDDRFSVVMSNSIVHHLPDPAPTLAESIRVATSDGLLFFRDLMRPDSPEQLDHLVRTHAGNESDPARQMFADSLHAALSLDEMRTLVRQCGFAEETVQATSDRHWTWIARLDSPTAIEEPTYDRQ